jgi:hydrogenase nickel incorporation protein HypA/HybF
MHELSIAMSLVQLVEEQVAAEPAADVIAVDVRIGDLASVVPEALQFAWGPATEGTRLEGSQLRIHRQRGSSALELTAVELSDPP